MSTGMATLAGLDKAVQELRKTQNNNLMLLKCTSSYPAETHTANILTIPHLRELLGYDVGLSDHIWGIGVSLAKVVLGAVIIEKHFILRH